MPKGVYLAVAIALALFGYLGLLSIGLPFLLTGLLMLVLAPMRERIEVLVPTIIWPWLFTFGYVLVGPLGCSTAAMPRAADAVTEVGGETRCNALLFTYAGDAAYSPPVLPALLVGGVLATSVALVVRRALIRQQSRPPHSTIGSAT